MNYKKQQLENLPDLPGSTASYKLKINEDNRRVWLVEKGSRISGGVWYVKEDIKKGDTWHAKEYPA